MATIESYVDPTPSASPQSIPWCYLLLDNLHEFATLAWYLVADSQLVEEVFSRAMTELDCNHFNESIPFAAYNQAREMIITQAVNVLAYKGKDGDEVRTPEPDFACDLPNLPRLAFMLRFVIRSSESEVARYLDVSPAKVRELVKDEIDYLSVSGPWSVLTSWREADVV